jgi:hypothetical protein
MGQGAAEGAGPPEDEVPELGRPSRHLWLGNIPTKPSRPAIEAAFKSFGPLETVRPPIA